MIEKKKICVITGTRAEYGLLSSLMKAIRSEDDLQLQVIVTGMHLSPEFGLTYREIENDGIFIDRKIEMLLSSDSPVGISKSIGLAMMGFADAFSQLEPELVVVLGDRFETFAAATAAMVARIPIAHLHGGETTAGVIDEALRHSITKMAHLHFTATTEYKRRVVQLGESPERVFNVGAIGVTNIGNIDLVDRGTLQKELDFDFGVKNLLVTFHPVTLETRTAALQFAELLAVCAELQDTCLLFTKPNADTEGRGLIKMLDNFVAQRSDYCKAFTSLGQTLYLSSLQFVDGVVGNSSSGLIEAPSFHIGTVNIGDRQKGRVKAGSVIDCKPDRESIGEAIKTLYSSSFQDRLAKVNNPYQGKKTVDKIINVLKEYPLEGILKKEFNDFSCS